MRTKKGFETENHTKLGMAAELVNPISQGRKRFGKQRSSHLILLPTISAGYTRSSRMALWTAYKTKRGRKLTNIHQETCIFFMKKNATFIDGSVADTGLFIPDPGTENCFLPDPKFYVKRG
jgi:hypothetical protein